MVVTQRTQNVLNTTEIEIKDLESQVKDLHNEVERIQSDSLRRVLSTSYLIQRIEIMEDGGVNAAIAALNHELDKVETGRESLRSFDDVMHQIEGMIAARATRQQLKGLISHLLRVATRNTSDWSRDSIVQLSKMEDRLSQGS
jgi:hypothetical protein